ncbi:hypothetical protein PG990_000538 [Apiospora arundinis]|uniref:Uncharacterized protein n=1 Tax=Apiospora arundinis TaxID=335852 RepID=A0ABR2I0Q2_9PEZI
MASISREDPFAAHTTDPNRYNAASALPPIDSVYLRHHQRQQQHQQHHQEHPFAPRRPRYQLHHPLLAASSSPPDMSPENYQQQQHHHHQQHPSQHTARAAGAAAAPRTNRTAAPSATASTAATVAPGAVRRNLFQSQLTRRPTSTSSNSAETLRMDADNVSNTSDIVIRDEHGDFEVGDPPTPPMDEPEAEALDDMQENERERQKLAEVVKHHQINHNRGPAQPEEVMEALRASMRAQVAALSEDSWMYEPEAETRNQ